MDIIKSVEHEYLKNEIPSLHIGDTIKVHQRIKEGNRERIQIFEGIIIKKQGGGVNATFTVRRLAYGVGVEKTFLVHSPMIEKIEVTRVGKSRRAKLFYLRDRVGKAAKTKENIGARVETKFITIKEELEEVANEEEQETPVAETVVEEVVNEVPAEEVATEETTENTENTETVETAETTEEVEKVETEETTVNAEEAKQEEE